MAERIGDAMFTTMAHEHDAAVADGLAALRAGLRCAGHVAVTGGRPVGTLDQPWNDMLETAEDRAPQALRLQRAKAAVRLDRFAAPAALLARHDRRG